MSNIYIQEPPALGKVLLKTSAGDIDIELWTREAPKACRNFIQLCMEGYYNGTIFHRVVPGFIVQGGDTIYNVLKLSEGLIGPDDRPEHPQTIRSTEVLINPFDDIVPRVQEKIDTDDKPKKKKKEVQGIKNFGLLSFGEEAEEDEGEAQEFRGKPKSTHDLLEDPKLSKKTAAELELEKEGEEESPKETEERKMATEATVSNIRDKLKKREKSPEKREDSVERDDDSKRRKESDSEEEYYLGKDKDMERLKERDRIRKEIKKLRKEMKGTKNEEIVEEKTEEKKEKSLEADNEMYKQFVEEQEKYKKIKEKIPKKGAAREDFTLQLLAKFKTKLHAIKEKAQVETETKEDEDNVDTDDWMGHTLCFEDKGAVLAKDASTKGDDWFDIYDPRNPINKRKRENTEKKTKK
ncbi:jg10335 [Pararge aegeria aegeria]|uniref:Spliceosome-associated protein CWC27 homolog n=2 Tax=Pararge aegeria TaxID=116150 RepID=A0A8S4RMI7_9NEOP|nr:jg10335 [Pararge aegeria aegeria]